MAFSSNSNAGGDQPPAAPVPTEPKQTVLVWDPVVRLFHWSRVISFVVAWVTGDELQGQRMGGYAIFDCSSSLSLGLRRHDPCPLF